MASAQLRVIQKMKRRKSQPSVSSPNPAKKDSRSSSGERRSLGGISKRGDRYLRTLLIQGARALISAAKQFGNTDRMRDWAIRLEQRRNNKKARVALANKLARVVWAIWQTDGAVYEAKPIAA
jgi:transposase